MCRGWDLDRSKMIRPEPHPGGFWPSDKAGVDKPFDIGKTATFEGSKPNPPTDYPHFTEDRVVTGAINPGPQPPKHMEILRNAAFDSLDDLFAENLVVSGTKAYVPTGKECRSLGGLIVSAKGVEIETYNNFKGKNRLRLRFETKDITLAPNITSSRAYAYHDEGKLDALNSQLAKASTLILRVGLARAFPEVPDKCYMQVNGLKIL